MADVIIVGAGIAGAAAATVLARAGISVTVIEPRDPVPPLFRAEILGTEHVEFLRRLGLLEPLRAVSTPIRTVEEAAAGRVFRRFRAEHYALPFDKLVTALRATIPAEVDFRVARVADITPGPDLCRITLDEGTEITARLIILATGASGGLFDTLNISRRMVSRLHSITFGATIAPPAGSTFDFDELTYWGDSYRSQIVLATMFPQSSGTRLNLVAHWEPGDSRVAEMRRDPDAAIARLMPRLQQVTGPFTVTGPVEVCPVNIHAVEGHIQPGLVLLGDTFSVSCPAVGTGVSKALNDLEILCRHHLPRWLSTPGMDVAKIAGFYADNRKRRYDQRTLTYSVRTRQTAIASGLRWRLRRAARTVKRQVIGTLNVPLHGHGRIAKALNIAHQDGMLALARQVRASLLYRALGHMHRRAGAVHEVPETSQVIALKQLTIDSANARDGVHYAPTPGPIVDWLHRLLPQALDQWSFIDVGCGLGRVVVSAARRPYAKVIGIDFARECCEKARRNVAATRPGSLRAGSVEIRHGDATELDLPDGPVVIYLFNPFARRVLERFLERLAGALEVCDRPIVIAYFNPEAAAAFDGFPQFAARRLPLMERLRFALLSPYRLKLYANESARSLLDGARRSADVTKAAAPARIPPPPAGFDGRLLVISGDVPAKDTGQTPPVLRAG